MTGGVAVALPSGGIHSLGSLIGFITVPGITERNSIMLIGHYRHLEFKEEEEFGLPMIIRGAWERPLAIIVGGNPPGQEIEYPMALVILGGLITSALANLFVLPLIYWKSGHKAKLKTL